MGCWVQVGDGGCAALGRGALVSPVVVPASGDLVRPPRQMSPSCGH